MVRNSRFEMRLTKSEFADLTRKARKAGLSTAAFVRKAVAGTEVKEAPPVYVPVLIMEVRKVGSSLKLNAKAVAQSSKKKVRKHVAVRYESTNTKIATVSGKGIVKARKKGTCYVYAYAQSGVYKRIKVIVK